MCVQAEDSDEVEASVPDNDDSAISNEEFSFIPDSCNNVSAATDCHAVSPTDNSLSLAIGDDVQELSEDRSSSVLVDDVSCPSELDTVTSDVSSRGVDQNDATNAAVSTTDLFVVNSDIPTVADTSTADSETSHIKDASIECSDTDRNCDVAEHDPGANEAATGESQKVLVEEIGGSELVSAAQSSSSKEANVNDKPNRPDPILSWSDSARDAVTSKTKCAVQFENSVIFDLDVE